MTDLNQLVEVGARAVHEALSRAHVIAYLDMPEDTADVVSRAYLAAILPLLADDLARVAKTGWVSADYAVVGIADADQCMKLCEHIESEIRTRIAAIIEGEGK